MWDKYQEFDINKIQNNWKPLISEASIKILIDVGYLVRKENGNFTLSTNL